MRRRPPLLLDHELYCEGVMLLGFKNASAAYQRLINKIFKNQIGQNMVYVDDMLVKSQSTQDYIANLQEAFNTLRQYKVKLNLAKCIFRVTSDKFLGFMVSCRGIEANLEKIRVVQEMASPRSVKEAQCFIGKVVAFNHFVSRSVERCLSFF